MAGLGLNINGVDIGLLINKIDALEKKLDLLTEQQNQENDIMSKKEVLLRLGITSKTYWNWVKDGKLKEYGIGAKRYCKRSEIQELLK